MLANENDMVPPPLDIMVQNLHIRAGRNYEGELSASGQTLDSLLQDGDTQHTLATLARPCAGGTQV